MQTSDAPFRGRDQTPVVVSAFVGVLIVGLAGYWFAGHGTVSWLFGDKGPGFLRSFRPRAGTLSFFLSYADLVGFVIFPLCLVSCRLWLLLSQGRISARAVLGFFLAAGLGVRILISLQDPISLQAWPLSDDSFYYFNIARNLATHGVIRHDSFNGTTGFQPLFLLLITPIYALVSDRNIAINAVLVLQSGIGMFFAFLLYKIGKLITSDAIAVLPCMIWAFSPHGISTDLNGLETSAALVVVAAVVYLYHRDFVTRDGPVPLGRYALLGCALGLGFLARVDLILLVPAIVIDQLLRRFRSEGTALTRKLAVTGAGWVILAAPWLVYVMRHEGSVLPSSGAAVRYLSLAYGFTLLPGPARPMFFDVQHVPFAYYTRSIERAWSTILAVFHATLPWPLAVLIVIGGLLASFRALRIELGRWRFFAFFGALLVSAYGLYIFGQWFYYRYFASLIIMYVAFVSMSASSISRSGFLLRFPRARRYGGAAVLTAIGACLMATSAIHVVRIRAHPESTAFYDAAEWINQNSPRDAVIGAFQSGILGYYLERRFCGLDGKINGEALKAMKENKIDRYVRERRISYLADWPWIVDALFVRHAQVSDPLRNWQIMREGTVRIYRASGGAVTPAGAPAGVQIRQ